MQAHPWAAPLINAADAISGAGQAVTHGMTVGLDEILAPLPAAIALSTKQGIPFSQAYDQVVQDYRQQRHAFEQSAPVTATGLEVAGGLASPLNAAVAPLFGVAAPGATIAARAANVARNVAAGAGVGAGAGFLQSEGDINQRLEGARQGAETGGVLSSAIEAVPPLARLIGSPVSALRPLINPEAAGRQQAGQILRETVGGDLPPVQPSPVAGAPLNVAQATGSPELASLVDKVNAVVPEGVPAGAGYGTGAREAELTAQNQAFLRNVPSAAATAQAPEVAAASASQRGVQAVRQAQRITNTEEKRLWNTPALTEPNISTSTAKELVGKEARAIREESPGIAPLLSREPLSRVFADLQTLPDKAAANQINTISSRFRKIARDFRQDPDVRHLATRLANAAQEGIWQAPEVAGRAPVTLPVLEGEARPAAAAPEAAPAPRVPPPPRPQTLTQFLWDHGGLAPHGDLSAMDLDKPFIFRRVGRNNVAMPLVRAGGLKLDYAREMAAEQGFIKQDTDVNGLLDALRQERMGHPSYRQGDEAAAEFWRHADQEADRQAQRQELARVAARGAAEARGMRITPAVEDHAAQLMVNDTNMHPEEALRQAVQAEEDRGLQVNAQRSAMGQPGVPLGAEQAVLPDLQQLREGVKSNPDVVRDLKAARAFTQREHQLLGHASFENILARNSEGNYTATEGTGLSKFFDFASGADKPGAIRDVGRFLDDIRSEWLKLTREEQGATYDPATIGPVRQELQQSMKDYVMSKFLAGVSSDARDMQGDRMIRWGKAAKWLTTNRDMLERTGAFTTDELNNLDSLRRLSMMIQRGYEQGRPIGAATYSRLMGHKFMDAFISPFFARAVGMATGAALGFLSGEHGLGVLFGAESGYLGADILQRLYNAPREAALTWLGAGIRDPQIAHDLAREATPRNVARFSDATKRWLRAALLLPLGGQAGQQAQPVQQPAMAQ